MRNRQTTSPIANIMGLTERSRALWLLAALFIGCKGLLYAQGLPSGKLGAEIQSLEQKLSQTGISAAERHDALVRLARLRQLSGDIAGAAVNWLDAAAAGPGDINALVTGAYCLAAIGEWETAASTLRPLLAAGGREPAVLQARYLDACLRTWMNTDASGLTVLAADPEFAPLHPIIYYTLWRSIAKNPGIGAGGAELWKSRLLAEFPQSPEARVAASETAGTAPVISAVQSPVWLLMPGTSGSAMPVKSPSQNAAPVKPIAPNTPVMPAVTAAAPAAGNTSSVVLQTGVFGKEANARAQAEALRKAGFTAVVSRKQVNGAEHWAVTVQPGPDSNKTIQELKKAGFDSFPVKYN